MIPIALRHYWSRFGWEITAFWFVSGANSLLLARGSASGMTSAMAVLEIVALAWITVRLVLAEDGFKTNGGWQTRPFSTSLRTVFPVVIAAVVVIAPALIRVLIHRHLFDGVAAWTDYGFVSWLRQVGCWFVFGVLPLKLFGTLILQGVDGRARTAAWATLALILLPITASMGTFFGKRDGYYRQSGANSTRLLAQGIQQEMKGATDFIGTWNDPAETGEVPAARLLAKVAFDSNASPAGIALLAGSPSLRGSRVIVRIRALLLDPGLAARLKDAVAILKYADGTCATCEMIATSNFGSPLPFFPADDWRFSGDFVSPLSLPEFEGDPRQLTRGLELYFFEPDWDRPLSVDPKRVRNRDGRPEVFPFSPVTMEELFTQFPWPDNLWRDIALPFLVMNATRKDFPFLLDRLEMDNRLMSVFIEKGWTADAMPVLRKLAKERIPMGIECIEELVKEQDASLSADLMAIALQHTQGLDRLEKALHSQPGFDWPAFAREAWKRQKYSNNWVEPRGEFWLIALWAAREGDESAFLRIAEEAARGKKWEKEQLVSLVEGGHEDVVGFVREHLGKFSYEPPTRKWRGLP